MQNLSFSIVLAIILTGSQFFADLKLVAQSSRDPYQLSFEDFEWNQQKNSIPLDGAVPLGEKLPTSQAIALFETRVAANSRDVAACILLGELYLLRAKEQDDLPSYDQAEAILRKALDIVPESLTGRLHLANVLLAKHRFTDANDLATAVLQSHPESTFGRALQFDALLELGDYHAAQIALERLVEGEQSPPVLARQARLAELTGDVPRAIELLTKCVTLEPMSSWYRWRLAGLCANSGQIKSAIEFYQAALHLAPEHSPSLVDLAVCQYASGNVEEAKRLLIQAVEKHAEPPAMSLLGDLLAATGETTQAEQWYQKTESAMADEAQIAGDAHAREVALFLADHKRDLPKALELAQRDLNQRQDVFAYDTLAWVQYQCGNLAEANAAIEQALRLGTRTPQILFHATMIAAANLNWERAEEFRKLLRATNPKFSILHSNSIAALSTRP